MNLNLDFNYIKNEGGKSVGQMIKKLTKLKELHIGVASKNFGYLGFKDIVKGMNERTDLEVLTFRCGVNRVGVNGATSVSEMLEKMTKLKDLDLGFVENYVGDEGISSIAKTIKNHLKELKRVRLDLSFNDVKGYGGIAVVRDLSERNFDYLSLSLSHNEFRDADTKLLKPHLKNLIKNNEVFEF